MDVTLLGPQRRPAAARAAVAELMPDGPVATINAGWQAREADTAELDDVLGGRMRNLALYRRWTELSETDPEYAAGERRLAAVLEELQASYALRLQHAMAALEAVRRRDAVPGVQGPAVADALRCVRDLDTWQFGLSAEARADFYAAVRLGERESVARHRTEIAAAVESSAGLVVTGGHVGVLLHLLHVFGLARLIRVRLAGAPLVAWSAGAMALAERVVLFAEHGSAGRRRPEVYAEGLGAYAGVLPFPHARRRLRLDDAEHLGMMARRFAPRHCLLLGDGQRVALRAGQSLPAGARILTDAGVAVAPG